MEIILVILAIAVLFYLTHSEKLEGSDDSNYEEAVASVTPDENQKMIFLTRDYLHKYHKICGYCIETRNIKKFINKGDSSVKYRCVYMFMVTGGYPYGISVNVELAMEPEPRVLLMSTQPITTKSDVQIVPYKEDVAKQFLSYDEMLASVKPKKLPEVK
jgi:hypothetical protein